LIQDLTPYIEKTKFDLADYWPGALESTSFDGKVYGLPRDSGVEVLYYNKDDFDKAGLKYPTDDWTWDDLRKAAEALTLRMLVVAFPATVWLRKAASILTSSAAMVVAFWMICSNRLNAPSANQKLLLALNTMQV